METYKAIKKDLFQFALIVVAIQIAYYLLPIWRDDTDGEYRSGLALRVDARTGCQYLEAQGGGITPRLDRSGKQMCGR